MSAGQELLAEIVDQLENDILHFAWLRQIVRLRAPWHTETEQIKMLVDAVTRLHHKGTIIVGAAREADGIVLVDPWPEQNHELKAKNRIHNRECR